MSEVWKTIPILDGMYEASTHGRIKSKARTVRKYSVLCDRVVDQKYKERILLTKPQADGYCFVNLGLNKKKWKFQVGRLILLAFVGECPEGMECCHNNGNQSINRLDNVRWDTHHNNNGDRLKHGTYPLGDVHPMAKLVESDIVDILNSPLSNKELGNLYKVVSSHIWSIRNRDVWKHVEA